MARQGPKQSSTIEVHSFLDSEQREQLRAEQNRVGARLREREKRRSQGLGGVPRPAELHARRGEQMRRTAATICEQVHLGRQWSAIPRSLLDLEHPGAVGLYVRATRGLRLEERLLGSARWGQWVADAALARLGAFV